MKKVIGFFIVLISIVTLVSYRSDVAMFGKAVIPIVFNGDNATNRTNLNMHLRGDSASGYQIWGRNNIGSEFFLASDTSDYSTTLGEFYTNNISPSVGDTVVKTGNFLYVKKITFSNTTIVNNFEATCNLYCGGLSSVLINCIFDGDGVLLDRDTLFYNASGGPNGLVNHKLPFDNEEGFTFEKDSTYYVGIYFYGEISPGDYGLFIGNEPVSTIANDDTWGTSFVSNPASLIIGSPYSFTETYNAVNFHYYYITE